MANSVTLSAIDAVIGGVSVTAAAQTVPLVDSVTGASGNGRYVIALTSAGTYVVTQNPTTNTQSTTQIPVAAANVINGVTSTADIRPRGISADAAAATLAHTPYADGSYMQSGQVTTRALAQAVVSQLQTATVATSFPTSPSAGQLVYRSDLGQLYCYVGTVWTVVGGGVSSVTGSGNISVSTGANPVVSITNAPAFSTSVTTPLVAAPSGQSLNLSGNSAGAYSVNANLGTGASGGFVVYDGGSTNFLKIAPGASGTAVTTNSSNPVTLSAPLTLSANEVTAAGFNATAYTAPASGQTTWGRYSSALTIFTQYDASAVFRFTNSASTSSYAALQSAGITAAGIVTATGGFTPGNGSTLGTAMVFGGTGIPSFSAPNGSIFIRYDGSSSASVVYVNTSGASSSGTTWTALGTGGTTYTGTAPITVSGSTIALTTPLAVTYGGTGSSTQNFVDLSSTQTAAGAKTWSSAAVFSSTISSGAVTLTNAGTLATSAVGMKNDGATTNGLTFNVPSGSTNGYLFQVAGATKMTISAAGSLTPLGGFTLPLSSIGTPGTNQMTVGVDGSGTGSYQVQNANGYTWYYNPSGTASTVATLTGTGNFTISGATATKASGTTWANPSDARIKQNVRDYAKGLDGILALRPVSFQYTGALGTPNDLRTRVGYIAQEVEQHHPEMVSIKPIGAVHDLRQLDTSDIVPMLVNAVKQLSARIVALESHLTA